MIPLRMREPTTRAARAALSSRAVSLAHGWEGRGDGGTLGEQEGEAAGHGDRPTRPRGPAGGGSHRRRYRAGGRPGQQHRDAGEPARRDALQGLPDPGAHPADRGGPVLPAGLRGAAAQVEAGLVAVAGLGRRAGDLDHHGSGAARLPARGGHRPADRVRDRGARRGGAGADAADSAVSSGWGASPGCALRPRSPHTARSTRCAPSGSPGTSPPSR